ncbi:MAG: tetratricopeptide repeat protein [Candidatus Lindowbacteria bacterium]|nr:tetratricopeptide repeat protein [Candidatus Lindowbacteria bacterium]
MGNSLRAIPIFGLAVMLVLLNGCGDSNLKKARKFQEEKDYDQAIHFYKLALEKHPDNNSARYGLVEAYANQMLNRPPQEVTPQMVEETMKEVRPIAQPLMGDVNVKRYMSLIYQMLAKRYADAGRDDKAAEAWEAVAEMEPSFPEAHFNLGVALSKTGQYEKAIAHFEKSVSLNPYRWEAYYAMGNSLLHLNRNEEAIKQYLKAIELNPEDPSARHNLGVAYARSGDNKKAIEEYKKALEIAPNYYLSYRSLREAYTAMNDTKRAKEADKKYKELTDAMRQAQEETAQKQGRPQAPSDIAE